MIRRREAGASRRGNIRGIDAAGRGSVAPPLPDANLLFGNEGDVGVTLVGSDVSNWSDVGLLGNDGAQPNAALRPSITTDGTLGDCLFFDTAVGDFFDWTGAASPSNNFTLCYALRLLGTTGTKMLLFTDGGATGVFLPIYDGGTGDYGVNDGTTTQYFGHTLAAGLQVVTLVVTGTNVDLYINRAFIGSITMASVKEVGNNVAVASPFSTTFTPDINLRAIYCYTVAKDAAGRSELWDYMAARHPGCGV